MFNNNLKKNSSIFLNLFSFKIPAFKTDQDKLKPFLTFMKLLKKLKKKNWNVNPDFNNLKIEVSINAPD
jgi:hypothetical protein